MPRRFKGTVEIESRRRLHDGFFKLDELTLRHSRFDGGMTPWLTREVLHQRRAVAVLPFDPHKDQVVLLEQFRPSVDPKTANPWLLEAVAGLGEGDEQLVDIARRETLEETGLEIGRLEWALNYRATPGCSTEFVSVYIGEVSAPDDGSLHGLADEGEDIRTLIFDRAEALRLLEQGEIVSTTAVIPLLYLASHHERLRSHWSSDSLTS